MTNKRMQDVDHLRDVAYSDAENLNARIAFWQLYGEPRDEAFSGFFDAVIAPENASILDIGCGPAYYWQWGVMHDRIPSGWTATLTDISPGMLDEARQTLNGLDLDARFEIADVCNLQFADESFDVVTANYMLYHAASQDLAFAEIARVLKPGGRLYAKTNSENHIIEFLDLQRKFIEDPTQIGTIGLSHEAFTLENGSSFIEPHFTEVEIIRDRSICKATDPKIVIDYAHSMDAKLDHDALTAFVNDEIERNGHFAVTRSSGMFVAQK
jgi:SAM-dependent methyltransferase